MTVLIFGARPEEVPELSHGEGLPDFALSDKARGLGVAGDIVRDEALLHGSLERDPDRRVDVADSARAQTVEHFPGIEAVEVLDGQVLELHLADGRYEVLPHDPGVIIVGFASYRGLSSSLSGNNSAPTAAIVCFIRTSLKRRRLRSSSIAPRGHGSFIRSSSRVHCRPRLPTPHPDTHDVEVVVVSPHRGFEPDADLGEDRIRERDVLVGVAEYPRDGLIVVFGG